MPTTSQTQKNAEGRRSCTFHQEKQMLKQGRSVRLMSSLLIRKSKAEGIGTSERQDPPLAAKKKGISIGGCDLHPL